jgi:hypothetical protein
MMTASKADPQFNMCRICTPIKRTRNLQATPLEDYQHRKPAHNTSAKKAYEHPCSPTQRALQVCITGWSQAALFRANSCRVTTAVNSGVSARVSRTFDYPQVFLIACMSGSVLGHELVLLIS